MDDLLSTYFELQKRYGALYEAYRERGVSLVLNPDDNDFAPGTPMEAYLAVGADALRVVVGALMANLRELPASVLDFPSGSGRVSRHLQAFFPEAEIVACDLYERHVDFCREKLGLRGIVSRENFDELDFGRQFDLIFCGSLLTHLPEQRFRSALRLLSRSLSSEGIAVITLHGRYADFVQKEAPGGWRYIEPELGDMARADAATSGFGFVDYEWLPRSPLFNKHPSYGISFGLPHWTMQALENDLDIRILGYTERGWDRHQDVLVIGRPGVNAK